MKFTLCIYRCGGIFINLENHLKKYKKKSCIGIWYVCRRCGQFYEYESVLKEHQANKNMCKLLISSPLQPDMPKEMTAKIRYLKAISESGGSLNEYLKRAMRRASKDEITNIMEACSINDLTYVFNTLSDSKVTTPTNLFKILAVISDFANNDTTNLEKRTLIREFVDKQITL